MKGVMEMLQMDSEIEAKYRRYAELSEKIFMESLSDDEAVELEELSDKLDEIEKPFYQVAGDKLASLLKETR